MSCPHGVWHEEDCEICQKDNRIFALEAEVRTVKAHLSQRDVLLQEAEAELAALEAKTCETCAKWGENICPHSSDLFLCETWKQYTTRDVFCSFWAERGTP